MERANVAFELRDQILLLATSPCVLHHLIVGHGPIVGDVEEVADLVEQDVLAPLDRKVLAQGYDPIGFAALDRLVLEVEHLFAIRPDHLVLPLPDDPLFHITMTRAWTSQDLSLGAPNQIAIHRTSRIAS